DGVKGLTTNQIAQKAEVSVATLYNLIGSIDDILDQLVSAQSELVAQSFEEMDKKCPAEKVIDEYVDAQYRFLKSNEQYNRAAQQAIFHNNIANGRSRTSAAIALNSLDLLANAVRQYQTSGFIKVSANADLLAEQMLCAQITLLEAWSTNVLCSERFRLSCSLHFWSLIRAWAEDSLVPVADNVLLERQQSIVALDSKRREVRESKQAG
ncbi:MAG: TetR/AcrR family transcriptional regulator, partial [Halioglobus sp.]